MRYRTRRARALEQCAERDRGSPRRVRVSEWSARDIADSQAGDKAPHDEQAPTDARARLAVHDHERRREAEAHLRGRPGGALDEVSPGDAFREGVPLGVGSAVRPRCASAWGGRTCIGLHVPGAEVAIQTTQSNCAAIGVKVLSLHKDSMGTYGSPVTRAALPPWSG